MFRCEHCDLELSDIAAVLVHVLHHIARMERLMTEFANDQAHLDADVNALTAGISDVETEIAALKAQPADVPLDFTALDAAVARVKADAPAAVAAAPAPATGSTVNLADAAPASAVIPADQVPTGDTSVAPPSDVPPSDTPPANQNLDTGSTPAS